MDALEAAIDLKIPAEEKLNSSGHNPGLRALLSIKNFSATLKKDYARLLEIEKELNKVYKDGYFTKTTEVELLGFLSPCCRCYEKGIKL